MEPADEESQVKHIQVNSYVKPASTTADEPHLKEELHVSNFTKMFVKHACWIACAILIATLALSAVGVSVAMAQYDIDKNLPLSDNYDVTTSVDVSRTRAYGELRSEGYSDGDDEDDDDDPDRDEEERSIQWVGFSFVYEQLEGDSILTKKDVEKIADTERALMDQDWDTYCFKTYFDNGNKTRNRCTSPTTILTFLYNDEDKHKEQCEEGFCITPFPDMCSSDDWGTYPCVSRVFDWRDGKLRDENDWNDVLKDWVCEVTFYRNYLLDKDADCDSDDIKTKFTRSLYSYGSPLDGYKNSDSGEQFCDISWICNGTHGNKVQSAVMEKVNLYSATPWRSRSYGTSPRGDKTINILHDSAFYITELQIVITDAMLAIFSIVFVFCYLWTNVGSFALASAGLFEIVASLPLAYFAYRVVFWQQYIAFLSTLALYLILCIGADDIFVMMDAWKASATQPPHISSSLETRFAWTYMQAVNAMTTTTATTVLCLLATAISPIPTLASFSVFTAMVVLFDYLLVISWYPACMIAYTRTLEPACPKCLALSKCCKVQEPGESQVVAERRSVVFLRDTFAPWIHNKRYVVLAGSFAIGVAMIVTLGVTWGIADGLPDFFGREHPQTKITTIPEDFFFVSEDWKYQVTLVYGQDKDAPVSFDGVGNLMPPPDRNATLHFNTSFDLTSDLQEKIVEDCEHARDSSLVDDKEVYCLLRDLKKWRSSDFPYDNEEKLRDALDDFYKSSKYAELTDDNDDYSTNTGFVEDGDNGIKAIWHTFNTTIPPETKSAPSELMSYYDQWQSFVDTQCSKTDGSCYHMLYFSPYDGEASWYLLRLFETMVKGVGEAVLYSLAAAFLVLIVATRNLRTTVAVLFTICITVASVLALVFAAGGELGLFEAQYTSLTIGLAIDYAVHMSHYYNHADGTRYEKARAAIGNIGVSIIGGAITTAVAGLPLFLCEAAFFAVYGRFITFTSVFAIFYTFFMLVPILMFVGPEGEQGRVDIWIRRNIFRKEIVSPAAPEPRKA